VLGRTGRNAGNRVRLVKGSHIITRKFWEGDQAYLLQNTDKRVIFVNPYEGDLTLIGTTDIPVEGSPDDVSAAPSEVEYLLSVVNRYFDVTLAPSDVLHTFSGVRPLFDDKADNPSAVTRDYVFDVDAPDGEAPALSIFGGKITTYRKLAEHALDRLKPFFPAMGPPWTSRAALPGGDMADGDFAAFLAEQASRYPWLDPALARGYARRYGTRMASLLDGASGPADLGRHFGAGLHEREARYLMAQEWAMAAPDILERRTKHGLHLSPPQRAAFEAWMVEGEGAIPAQA
jgi:D-erythritol 1-phosphate dehydrogenase